MNPDSSKETPRPKRLKTFINEVKDSKGNSTLHRFVMDNSNLNDSGREAYITAVLRSMSDCPSVDALNGDGYSALYLAVMKNNHLMVKKLLSLLAHIDVDKRCKYEDIPGKKYRKHRWTKADFPELIAIGCSVEEFLEKRGFRMMKEDDESNFSASEYENLDAFGQPENENLIKQGSTALHLAVCLGYVSIVEELLRAKADVNARDLYDHTAFYFAIKTENLDAVQVLVAEGADVNTRINSGETPLHTSLLYHKKEVFKFLMNSGANCNATNELGESVLHYAAMSVDEIFELLLGRGVDVNAVDIRGETPLFLAYHCFDHVALLADHGARFDITNQEGETPLHKATWYAPESVLEILLERGCDMNARDTRTHCTALRNLYK